MQGDKTVPYDSIAQGSFGDSITGDTIDMANKNMEVSISKDDHRHEGVRMPFTIEQADSVFGLLLLCFLFFAHIFNGGFTFLKENLGLLFSFEKSQRMHHQITARETLYNYFLVFQAIVLISICVYDVFVEYDPLHVGFRSPLVTIISFIILIALFYGVKDTTYKLLGYIFDTKKQIAIWRQTQAIAIEVLGILYFIPTLLILYGGYYSFQIIVFMAILFLLVQITLFYQIIIFFIGEKFNFLYLIAYLCTFEILPYIFLFIGLVYLYRIDVFNTIWL